MPKMKANSSAKKRFGTTGSGKLKRKHAYKSHLLTKKDKKRKKRLEKFTSVSRPDRKRVRKMIGK